MEYLADFIALTSNKPAAKLRRSQIDRREDVVIREFVDGIFGAVTDGATHPLFDPGVARLVDLAAREGMIEVSHTAELRGRHVALAGQLLSRLPLFDDASVDEVLDIRSELESPLVSFRGALLRYSDTVQSAPWEAGFPEEAELIFHKEVAPAVQEIESAVAANSFMAKLARRAIDKPVGPAAGSALSILLSKASSLPEALVLGLGLSATAATLVYDAYSEWKAERREVEGNSLYFYYETGRRLR